MKKIYFLSFFIGLLAPSGYGQKICDTIIIKDGRRLAADVVRTDREGIVYKNCGVEEEREYFISREKVKAVKCRNDLRSSMNLPPSRKNAGRPEPRSRLREATNLRKPRTILWAGLSLSNAYLFDFETAGSSIFQFGVETGFKNSPVRVGTIARPISLSSGGNYYDNFKKKGVSGEIGLVLKKFSLGRLTGNMSRAYGGLDLFIGRQAYTYTYTYNPSLINQVSYTWTTVMPRVGYQFTLGMLALDLALPIGYQRYHYTYTGDYQSEYRDGTLILQPSASLGFRF